ncbi:MAG: radical SAM protein [Rikenellaceae bacterium]
MATSLFNDIIFGPISSRRLGLSLGVNLLPLDNKLCSFECIYCECGWTKNEKGLKKSFNKTEDVLLKLREKLQELTLQGTKVDVITFAGNGEPTMHPDFEHIIDKTIEIRDEICPEAKISVLSNATMIHKQSVRSALLKVDNNILKLDSAFDSTVAAIDKPRASYSVKDTVENMKKFNGQLIIQTMFLKGTLPDNTTVDNTTSAEVSAYLKLLQEIKPKSVMIYTIDRDTPLKTLQKAEHTTLENIAKQIEELNISCSVAG